MESDSVLQSQTLFDTSGTPVAQWSHLHLGHNGTLTLLQDSAVDSERWAKEQAHVTWSSRTKSLPIHTSLKMKAIGVATQRAEHTVNCRNISSVALKSLISRKLRCTRIACPADGGKVTTHFYRFTVFCKADSSVQLY